MYQVPFWKVEDNLILGFNFSSTITKVKEKNDSTFSLLSHISPETMVAFQQVEIAALQC